MHRVIYTVEVEVTFTDDEMKSQEDLQQFFDYCTKQQTKDGWIAESVREGNFVIAATRVEV